MADETLCGTYISAHPTEAARVLERQPAVQVAALLSALHPAGAAAVIERMIPTVGAECLAHVRTPAAAAVLEHLDAGAAAAILRRLDPGPRDAFLNALGALAAPVRILLSHAEGTAGSVMDPRALALPDDVTAGEAVIRAKRSARFLLYYLYVVDRGQRLAGVLDMAELMRARPGARLAGVMHAPVAAISASTAVSALLAHPGWEEFHAMPVVDDAGRFLGAIRYQAFRGLARADAGHPSDSAATVLALGELYWLGVSGFLRGLATTLTGDPLRGDALPGAGHGV